MGLETGSVQKFDVYQTKLSLDNEIQEKRSIRTDLPVLLARWTASKLERRLIPSRLFILPLAVCCVYIQRAHDIGASPAWAARSLSLSLCISLVIRWKRKGQTVMFGDVPTMRRTRPCGHHWLEKPEELIKYVALRCFQHLLESKSKYIKTRLSGVVSWSYTSPGRYLWTNGI